MQPPKAVGVPGYVERAAAGDLLDFSFHALLDMDRIGVQQDEIRHALETATWEPDLDYFHGILGVWCYSFRSTGERPIRIFVSVMSGVLEVSIRRIKP